MNIAFQDLIYIGNKNFYGTDTLKIVVDDLGNLDSVEERLMNAR